MSCTLDVSVFIAAARREEEHYAASREFIERVQSYSVETFCPTLVLPECAAAIAPSAGDAAVVGELVAMICEFPGLRLVDVDLSLARRAAQIATACRIRGADASKLPCPRYAPPP